MEQKLALPEKYRRSSQQKNPDIAAGVPGFVQRDGNDIRRSEAEQAFDGNGHTVVFASSASDAIDAGFIKVADIEVQAEVRVGHGIGQ